MQVTGREVVLLNLAGTTTSGTGPDINLFQGQPCLMLQANCTTVTGTTPTIQFFLQNKLIQSATADTAGNFPTGTALYDDYLSFTIMTTTGTRLFRIVPTGYSEHAAANQTLAAGTARNGPVAPMMRIAYVIGGTTPAWTVNVTAQLIPQD